MAKILLIGPLEDKTSKLIRNAFSNNGYSVNEANSVISGKNRVRDYKPDLVIYNEIGECLGEPGMACQLIGSKEGGEPIPIIIVTRRIVKEDYVEKLAHCGVRDVLSYQISLDKLLVAVESVLTPEKG
ncbi:MAG: hypothetical protein ABH817_00810 [archaeon]